jgi:hypothetical protein
LEVLNRVEEGFKVRILHRFDTFLWFLECDDSPGGLPSTRVHEERLEAAQADSTMPTFLMELSVFHHFPSSYLFFRSEQSHCALVDSFWHLGYGNLPESPRQMEEILGLAKE